MREMESKSFRNWAQNQHNEKQNKKIPPLDKEEVILFPYLGSEAQENSTLTQKRNLMLVKKIRQTEISAKKGRKTALMGVSLLLQMFSVLFEFPVIRKNITFTCISYHLIFSAFNEIKH